MEEKCTPFTTAIDIAQQPKRGPVKAAYAEAMKCLKLTPASRLDVQGRREAREIADHLLSAIRVFEHDYAAQILATNQHIKKLLEVRGRIKIALIAALIAAVAVLGVSWQISVVLAIAVVVTHMVAMKRLAARSEQIARESWTPTQQAVGIIGHPASLHAAGAGLYDRADRLYLNSLDEVERTMEMSRREAARQDQQSLLRRDEHRAMRQEAAASAQTAVSAQKNASGHFHGHRVREA